MSQNRIDTYSTQIKDLQALVRKEMLVLQTFKIILIVGTCRIWLEGLGGTVVN